ncbi:DUF7504 family protein [Haloarcula nitratireducens]|uniref:Halobacterial output domain-containing protein n=1 Tax=Haloarcula nitratireducens TaxID=2487749 RepID=A0AAW4PE35_9EURY|nr:hypothetical protein [Halomicroarcula nitratireducens]MBX0295873.1 hypothetical protein [Halomicroarcula nitratireducens]
MTERPDWVAAAATTLVAAPSLSGEDGGGGVCTAFLDRAGPSATSLWVTYTRTPSACVEAYRETSHSTGATPTLSVIAVGDTGTDAALSRETVTVQTVSTPSDLTGLGITLSQSFSAHDDVVVCFDSLTALLQYVDLPTVYEFLHAVTGQLDAADAGAHFHVDPTAHDRQTVDALASPFDAVVECCDGNVRFERADRCTISLINFI